jgi:hypothetical protein
MQDIPRVVRESRPELPGDRHGVQTQAAHSTRRAQRIRNCGDSHCHPVRHSLAKGGHHSVHSTPVCSKVFPDLTFQWLSRLFTLPKIREHKRNVFYLMYPKFASFWNRYWSVSGLHRLEAANGHLLPCQRSQPRSEYTLPRPSTLQFRQDLCLHSCTSRLEDTSASVLQLSAPKFLLCRRSV